MLFASLINPKQPMKASYYLNNCQQIEIKSKLAQEFNTTVCQGLNGSRHSTLCAQ